MLRTPYRIALFAALLALPVEALSQETTTTVPPKVEATTEVLGNIPVEALVGRWVIVSEVKTPDGKVKPVVRAWELRQGPEHLELVLEHGALPQRVNEEINDAGMKGMPWKPDDEDLREIAAGFGPETPLPADYRSIQTRIIGGDALPPEFQEDEISKGSKFVISVVEGFSGRQGVIKNYATYAVRTQTPTTLGGAFVNTTIAAAPLPIPITLKGDFEAYKLAGPSPSRSWLQRLFSGCQRG